MMMMMIKRMKRETVKEGKRKERKGVTRESAVGGSGSLP